MGPSSKYSVVANPPSRAGSRSPLGTVPAEGKECIWMSAGVLSYRLCDRAFDCEHCLLDKALHGDNGESAAAWTPGEWGPSGYRLFPQDRAFSPAHTWVLQLGSASVRLGVDALVAWLLSEATAVELPAVGTWLERGEVAATLLAKGGKLTIPAPISGRVLGHNEAAQSCPELVVSAPYGAGWLIDMDVETGRKNRQFTQLLCGPDMEKLSRSHLHDFHHRTDELLAARPSRVGATMADGGRAVSDPRAMLGSARYLKLVQELLT
jgi:glycine cleavage system H protein